ncbi:hypothetical protein CSUNSWCD_566 [Campylobacter showae CSUNSWCD]|uniref:Uncharacterized protein n=1 Tax=Campylobacter showae CSUNSWCD TaxID=1244083 RepID=M5IIX5_9BACT|nr:hypothetical protein CSUNSWCD_566 [Campylobacter showae CSUNSWCD]
MPETFNRFKFDACSRLYHASNLTEQRYKFIPSRCKIWIIFAKFSLKMRKF